MSYSADQLPTGLDPATSPLAPTDGLVGDQGGIIAVRIKLQQVLDAVLANLFDDDPALTADSDDLAPTKSAVVEYVNALGWGVPLARFGTLANDGATDDAAVLQDAIDSGFKQIDARGLNLAILTQIDLAAGVTIDLTGTTITTTGSTITTFKADTIDDWALLGPFTVVGAGTTSGTAKALHVVGCNRFRVRGMRAKNVKGHGFYLQPGTPSGSARGDQGVYESCIAEACYWGWEDTPGAGAEYTIVRDFSSSGCTTWGVKTCAGNVEWNGGHDIDNVGDGFVMVGGSNHAHGIVTGRNINHNGTYNLNLSGVVNGETFQGCHFYEKLMLLDGCKGVQFDGCVIDIDGAGTIEVNSGTGSGDCYMSNCYFPGDYGGVTISGTAPTTLKRHLCRGTGTPGDNVGLEVLAIACSDETTALTTGTAKATFRMPYAFKLTDVRASVTTAPTGTGNLTVDVNEAGSTILSTKLTFDASEKTTTTAATPRVISDSDLADDAEITVDIDAVSGTITGAGLKVYLIGYQV